MITMSIYESGRPLVDLARDDDSEADLSDAVKDGPTN
jgi:hypothetical protein